MDLMFAVDYSFVKHHYIKSTSEKKLPPKGLAVYCPHGADILMEGDKNK